MFGHVSLSGEQREGLFYKPHLPLFVAPITRFTFLEPSSRRPTNRQTSRVRDVLLHFVEKPKPNNTCRAVRGIRLLKLMRILRLSRKMANVHISRHLNPSIVRLIKLLGKIVFAGHLLGCLWFMVDECDVNGENLWRQCGGDSLGSKVRPALALADLEEVFPGAYLILCTLVYGVRYTESYDHCVRVGVRLECAFMSTHASQLFTFPGLVVLPV